MNSAATKLSPAFLERWQEFFTGLIHQRWGQLWPAVLTDQRYRIHQIIDEHCHQVAQRCCCHPHRRFQTPDGTRMVMDVYLHLAHVHRHCGCELERQKIHPMTLVADAFPTLIETAAFTENLNGVEPSHIESPVSMHSRGHQACPQGLDWIPKFWSLLGNGCTSNQITDHSLEVGHYLGIPILICQTCGSTPLGFDQTPFLGESYSDQISVLSACRIHVASMMNRSNTR